MPRSATNMLDLSILPAAQRREVVDFMEFLLSRRVSVKQSEKQYRFNDLCGTLKWQGDAVTVQRSLRNEW